MEKTRRAGLLFAGQGWRYQGPEGRADDEGPAMAPTCRELPNTIRWGRPLPKPWFSFSDWPPRRAFSLHQGNNAPGANLRAAISRAGPVDGGKFPCRPNGGHPYAYRGRPGFVPAGDFEGRARSDDPKAPVMGKPAEWGDLHPSTKGRPFPIISPEGHAGPSSDVPRDA